MPAPIAMLMPVAKKSSKPSKPASGGTGGASGSAGKKEKPASGNKQPSNMLASGNTKAVIDKKKKKIHVESNAMDEMTKKTMVVETKEPNAKKKKKIEVETKETNVKEKKKEVETKVTKKKNMLASGSDSSATKRNEETFKKTRDDTSSESYSYYSDSSLASGSEDEPGDEPKPVSKPVDKPAEQPQPAEEEAELPDWGSCDSYSESIYSETSEEEEEADEPATGGAVTGDSIGDATRDVSDMLATGGMKVRLTSATGKGNDFDVGYEDEKFSDEKDGDGWTWHQWQPWKKTKFESFSGHWQKSSSWQESWQQHWQQKSSWPQKSSWTRKRQYHNQQCHQLASGSYDGSSSSMRQQLAEALSRWEAFPSSSLVKEGGLEDFASRAIVQLKKLEDDPPGDFHEWALQTALPLDRPASGGVGYMSIKDVVTFHRGEVRQLGGGVWAICDSKIEEFAKSHAQLKGLIVKLASGSEPSSGSASDASGGPLVKVAKVFSVMDLFMALGKAYSAKELYDAYLSCEIIARRRMRSKRQ